MKRAVKELVHDAFKRGKVQLAHAVDAGCPQLGADHFVERPRRTAVYDLRELLDEPAKAVPAEAGVAGEADQAANPDDQRGVLWFFGELTNSIWSIASEARDRLVAFCKPTSALRLRPPAFIMAPTC